MNTALPIRKLSYFIAPRISTDHAKVLQLALKGVLAGNLILDEWDTGFDKKRLKAFQEVSKGICKGFGNRASIPSLSLACGKLSKSDMGHDSDNSTRVGIPLIQPSGQKHSFVIPNELAVSGNQATYHNVKLPRNRLLSVQIQVVGSLPNLQFRHFSGGRDKFTDKNFSKPGIYTVQIVTPQFEDWVWMFDNRSLSNVTVSVLKVEEIKPTEKQVRDGSWKSDEYVFLDDWEFTSCTAARPNARTFGRWKKHLETVWKQAKPFGYSNVFLYGDELHVWGYEPDQTPPSKTWVEYVREVCQISRKLTGEKPLLWGDTFDPFHNGIKDVFAVERTEGLSKTFENLKFAEQFEVVLWGMPQDFCVEKVRNFLSKGFNPKLAINGNPEISRSWKAVYEELNPVERMKVGILFYGESLEEAELFPKFAEEWKPLLS